MKTLRGSRFGLRTKIFDGHLLLGKQEVFRVCGRGRRRRIQLSKISATWNIYISYETEEENKA